MLLVIDQGNSDVVFGVHNGSDWVAEWRTPTTNKSMSTYEALMRQWILEANLNVSDIDATIVSSVVPEYREAVITFVRSFLGIEPLVLGQKIYEKLELKLNSPHEIGSDLVANAIAAFSAYPNDPCIIVDFGTALTVTTILGNTILGVAIAPGLQTAVKSLFKHTAQLPEVPLELPESLLGKNTIHAIQSGVLHGYIGLVKHLVAETKKELQTDCKVLATGGLSSILKPLHDEFDLIDPKFTLNGLRLIHEKLKF